MDTTEKPKRPWWRKKRWWTAAAFVFLLPTPLYLLAGGPVIYYTMRTHNRRALGLPDHSSELWGTIWDHAYYPVVTGPLEGTLFGNSWWDHYLGKWHDRADTDVESEWDAAWDAEFGTDEP